MVEGEREAEKTKESLANILLGEIYSHIYSFGVLMLEITSGRKNNRLYKEDRVLNLVGYVCQTNLCRHVYTFLLFKAWESWNEGGGLEIMHTCCSPLRGRECSR
ncbi:Plant protein of unknown function D [Prunus dulcis]|uniref:Serine-threonine/tyrosine-protein kinase catalytic domain-containing protein n=1 Tax=Prunus dulcis TaxID=3755 RepID=A0A4Y1RB82_PRUDU|nr:Plant protein of unknown function D [Prunus dulcis]